MTELIIVLAIMAILAVIATPSYKAMIARAQARSVAVEIASQLRLARQLAMSRRERFLVQFDLAQGSLASKCADSGEVLEIYRYGDKAVTIEGSTAGPDILFHPSGRSATATTIIIVDKDGKKTMLTVSLTGRVTIS